MHKTNFQSKLLSGELMAKWKTVLTHQDYTAKDWWKISRGGGTCLWLFSAIKQTEDKQNFTLNMPTLKFDLTKT